MATPTFTPRVGYELLKKIAKDTNKNLRDLGRYMGEQIKNFLGSGEVYIANSQWPLQFWEFQEFRKYSPEAAPELVAMHRQVVVVFSDSTLRMGRVSKSDSTRQWLTHWHSHLEYLHSEKFNIFGEEIVWEFNVQVATTSLDIIDAIQHDVDRCGKGIRGYNKRIIIMGCLNDIALSWRDG